LEENQTENHNPNGHRISYRILNHIPDDPPREIDVLATQEELETLGVQGYLVREGMFQGAELAKLRNALDKLENEERAEIAQKGDRQFGGIFLRYMMDKDETFFDFMKFQPFLSVARALMGPQIQMSISARISYPGPENQETIWHQHLRFIPKPLPLWFTRPHGMDVLVYLDDVDDANGPLCVMPGSYNWLHDEPPGNCFDDLPGQVKLYPKAGTAVFLHSNLWHRAMPTKPEGTKRRLLLFGYTPTWLKVGKVSGNPPADGLTFPLRKNGDKETMELLGLEGYM
jgi:ectoine hydroxylase-related dioxygenase (phytanoyl-CoA dioxygenase family)